MLVFSDDMALKELPKGVFATFGREDRARIALTRIAVLERIARKKALDRMNASLN